MAGHKEVYTQSANSNAQVVSLNGGVSTMGSSGGMTCYKAACSSGYYLDAPNSTYFKSTSKTGTIGLTCYKAIGCQSGYYNGGSSQDYHGYKCSKCTYSCPPGYSTSVTCGAGYIKTSATKVKDQNVSTCPTSSEQCYKCVAKTCSDYGLYSSRQSGKHCSTVSKDPSLTCYDCHTPNYSWCPSGSQIGACSSGYYVSSTKPKECTRCSATSGTCNVCSANTCASEGYVDSCPSGQNGTPVKIDSGTSTKTCYKDCQDNYYSCDGSAGPTNDCYTWHCEFDEAHKSQVSACNYDSTYCTIDGGSSWCGEEDSEPPYFTISGAGSMTGVSSITSITITLTNSYSADLHCTINFSGFAGSQFMERFSVGPLNVTIPANTTSKNVSVNMRSLSMNCPIGNGGYDNCSSGYIMLDYDTYCDNAVISSDLEDIIVRGANTSQGSEFVDIVQEYLRNF